MSVITGRIGDVGEIVHVWKAFRFKYEKGFEDAVLDFSNRFDDRLMNDFEIPLQHALSTPLSKSLWHKVRPSRRKKFPHMNTGQQINSIFTGTNYHFTKKGNISLVGSAYVDVPYATFTNAGLREPATAPTAGWVGWLDDVIDGEGRNKVKSIGQVFKAMMKDRRVFKVMEGIA
jgi:hypothetical protein